MISKKNLEILIDAYWKTKARVGAECPALVFVGSGAMERPLRERCLAHGLSIFQVASTTARPRQCDADVFFFGFRQVEELPEFYALATAFILPSREEEWGLVVNEAMACGLPVVVSQVAGCVRDLVRHGVNGFAFDPLDADALAGQLEMLARNPELAQKMGLASQGIIAEWGCERFAEGAQRAIEVATQQP